MQYERAKSGFEIDVRLMRSGLILWAYSYSPDVNREIVIRSTFVLEKYHVAVNADISQSIVISRGTLL